ncbi:MAG TPA: acyl-CoA dehydrogenase family protein [Ramlibacter sp.]|nr:acyl-CoA dehydrogenase family protein [Ramlibacter sp.]
MSNTDISVDYEAFRREVRDFARLSCPPALREAVCSNQKLGRKEFSAWQKILFARGWAAPGWPRAEGGTGWDLRQRYIFEEAMAQLDCPPQYHHGIGHIGPVLLHFGTPEQKRRFLPGILDGTHWWCQGYSEPAAGSDLASLKTRAVRDGDAYVVDGQKIWTSHAHEADIMYTLVRTSTEAKKQDGISLLLIPLDTPGISIRPIKTIDGWHHVNEVFLDNVRVPAENLLGQEGQGWRCAKFLLDRERLSPATVPRLARLLDQVGELAAAEQARHAATRDLSSLAERLLTAQAEVRAASEMLLSAIDEEMRGSLRAAKASALKLYCSELGQRIIEIAFDAIGPDRVRRFIPMRDMGDAPTGAEWIHNYLFFRSRTIAGGTTEVQKNVIARELFGA